MVAHARKWPLISSLDDVLARFASLAVEPEPVRGVRGVGLAVAQDWLLRLPEGKLRDQAIETLAVAVDLAVDALKAG